MNKAKQRQKETVYIGLRISPQLKSQIELLAKKEQRMLSQMIRLLLESGLASR